MKNNLSIHFLLITIICLLAFTTVLLSSCKKHATAKKANATIVFTGTTAIDGCGWLVQLDSAENKPGNTFYSPTNLDKRYQINNLRVAINYTILKTKYACGLLVDNGGQTQIDVLHIEPINETH